MQQNSVQVAKEPAARTLDAGSRCATQAGSTCTSSMRARAAVLQEPCGEPSPLGLASGALRLFGGSLQVWLNPHSAVYVSHLALSVPAPVEACQYISVCSHRSEADTSPAYAAGTSDTAAAFAIAIAAATAVAVSVAASVACQEQQGHASTILLSLPLGRDSDFLCLKRP